MNPAKGKRGEAEEEPRKETTEEAMLENNARRKNSLPFARIPVARVKIHLFLPRLHPALLSSRFVQGLKNSIPPPSPGLVPEPERPY